MTKLSDNAVATPHWDEEGNLAYVRVETEYYDITHHVNLEAAEVQALMRHTRAWQAQQAEASGAADRCPACGHVIDFSTARVHYEDTSMLCDGCLGKQLGIKAESEARGDEMR